MCLNLKHTCGISTEYLISLKVIERGQNGSTIPLFLYWLGSCLLSFFVVVVLLPAFIYLLVAQIDIEQRPTSLLIQPFEPFDSVSMISPVWMASDSFSIDSFSFKTSSDIIGWFSRIAGSMHLNKEKVIRLSCLRCLITWKHLNFG